MFKRLKKILILLLVIVVLWPLLSFAQSIIVFGADRMRNDVIITAHRGGAGYGPENSLSCIRRSVEAGVPSIEIDVQLTADGHVIVCHDNKVNRTTNGKGYISKMTLDELRALHLVDDNGREYAETLPLLGEVLEAIGGRAHLLLEIKRYRDTAQELQRAVVEELRRYNAEAWTTVQSFSDDTLQEIHSLNPTLRLEKLAFCKVIGLPLLFDGWFRRFSYERYSFVESINFFYGGVSQSFVEDMHANGKRVRIWTVNKSNRRPNLGVDGIITDYPDMLMEHYGLSRNK